MKVDSKRGEFCFKKRRKDKVRAMKNRFLNIKSLIFLFFLLTIITPAFSAFLEDSENAEVPTINEEVSNRGDGLAPHIASLITAENLPGVDSSIKISWKVNSKFKGKFIVGRAKAPINSPEKAFRSESIKIVASDMPSFAIDSGLKPGNYFYVVLAESSIKKGTLELYGDVNYTTLPITIEDSKIKKIVRQVTGVNCKVVDSSIVKISWDLLQKKGIIYTIYRGRELLNSVEKLKNANKISMVVDKHNYIDYGKNLKGKFYYAVTSKKLYGKENLSLIANQNYITKHIYLGEKPISIVSKIESLHKGKDIVVKWNPVVGYKVKGYAVYRLSREISNSRLLSLSEHLGSLESTTLTYVDRSVKPGIYYYAVLAKLSDGSVNLSLQGGSNYTLLPVVIKNDYKLYSLRAFVNYANKKITVKWRYKGDSGEKIFRLYFSKEKLEGENIVDEKKFIREVNILDGEYRFSFYKDGNYYFYMIPDIPGKQKFLFRKGENITLNSLSTKFKKKSKKIYVRKKSKTIILKKKDKVVRKKYSRKKKIYIKLNVDMIINETYFDKNYLQAIKELVVVIESSNNKREVAKAKLFIARSYIAMNKYNRAMNYLVQNDVNKYYLSESQFWRDYVIVRVKDIKSSRR